MSADHKKNIKGKIDNLQHKITDLEKEQLKWISLLPTLQDIEKAALFNPYDQNQTAPFFDADWMFGVNKKFDIVIGNPPYVQLQKMKAQQTIFEKQNYLTYSKASDLYCLFYEKGVQLLKEKGILAYITSNKWMRAGYGESMRNFFVTKTNPLKLIDFGGVQVFESATVDTNIILTQKNTNQNQLQACVIDKNNYLQTKNITEYFKNYKINLNPTKEWVITTNEIQSLKDKITKQGTPLKDWNIQIFRGILTGLDDVFVINGELKNKLIAQDSKSAEILKPIIRGRDTFKYRLDFQDLWLIASHNGIKDKKIARINVEKDYPAIYSYLQNFEEVAKKRQDKGDNWTNLRNCSYWEEFTKPKIIYPNMTKYLPFIYDESGYYVNAKCYIMTGESLKYLTAIFNSTLFKFCFRDNFPELQGGTRELQKVHFEKLPIKNISATEQQPFEVLVDKILAQKAKGENTQEFENEIDALVFGLYGLSEEEIKICSM